MKLPQKLLDMQPYDPTENLYPVKLDANESPFPTPSWLREKIAAAAAQVDLNCYPDPSYRPVLELAAALYGVEPENVAAGNGSDELISILTAAFCQRGDKILTLEPDFSMYGFYAGIGELAHVTVQKGPELAVTADEILAACRRERPAMLIFSNPCNPTGQGLARDQVCRVMAGADCLVVVDEAYMDFWDQTVIPDAVASDNTVVLRTCSKALGFAAARLGFAVASPLLISQLQKVRSPFNLNGFTQVAAQVVLGERDYLQAHTAAICRSVRELSTGLEELARKYRGKLAPLPTVTNFICLRCWDPAAVYGKLLEKGICVRRFPAFLRVSAGTPEENSALLRALEELCSQE